MTQESMSFDGFSIAIVERNYYRINFRFMTKNKAADRMKNADLRDKSGKV